MANITIKDIAKICGVGTSTVSRAMNDDQGISPETKERILKVIKEFHYVPNNSARNLKVSEKNTIGVLVKGAGNRFLLDAMSIIRNELQRYDYGITFRELRVEDDDISIAQEMVKENRLKGVIFLGGMIPNVHLLNKVLDVPYVLCTVGMNSNYDGVNLVAIDDVRESRRVVEYLINMGHKRIAFIGGRKDDNTVGEMRLRGYREALKKNNIDFDSNLVRYQRDDLPYYSEANGYTVMKELLSEKVDFTALFTVSDWVAFGAYKAIYDSGKKIPEDYSVVGFDGIETTKYMYPSLTSARQPIEDIVKSTVKIILDAIDGEKKCRHMIYETELMEQDSVRRL